MSDLTSDLSTVNHPPVKFHPPKNSKLPKRSFGAQGKDQRFFVWSGVSLIAGFIMMFCKIQHFVMYAWQLNVKRNFSQYKRSFIMHTTSYMYWKEVVTAFKRHTNRAYHQEGKEAVETLPAWEQDIGELMDAFTQSEKALNRYMFTRILQSLCYLPVACQGLALRAVEIITILLSCYNWELMIALRY